MKDFSRPLLPISTVLFLTAIFLGILAKPVSSDTTGFLSLINSYRQQNGVGTLVEDQNLTNAACWMAPDLDINGFSHTDSLGRSMAQRLSDFGVTGSRAENIFYTTSGSSANYAFDAWKNSSGHNTNMLNGTYTRIGIGRANVSGKWYWVTDFANGSATSLTNQCGVNVNNSTTQTNQGATQKSSTNTTKTPSQPQEIPVSVVETPPTSTIAAEPTITEATKSATLSAPIIKIDDRNDSEPTPLVKGVALGSILAVTFALFAFILWKFIHSKFSFRKMTSSQTQKN